ncbi:hypothetical protein L1049_010862 [Liquidambar formosana]|uniref:Uncharacterized protein n=1 Tax=Liquidambar formosana TaxID=63359 RepID=A0AAP0RRE0_LIQFO
MAIDGSFCLEAELERFLARCPKLGCIPRFVSLSKKGQMVTEEEVVNLVAELFLHPNYTIPLLGCFRPIVRKIVDRAVALLRMVPNLRSDSDDRTKEFKEGKTLREAENVDDEEEVDSVIEFYAKSGRGLNLHELACLAFCRALDLAPFLLGSILSYFKFAPPPFERILKEGVVFELSKEGGTHFLDAARISYRLLLMEPEVFSKLWDWSCFLDVVQQLANLDRGDSADFVKNMSDLRWCAIRILLVILKMSERANTNFGIEPKEELTCLLRWEEFCQDVSLEKAGWYLESSKSKKFSSNGKFDLEHENCLPSLGLGSLAVSSLQFPRD